MKGKTTIKRELAGRADFNPASLPYNRPLLAWPEQESANGRRLILCTASDCSIADAIARHLGVFDEVTASDGAVSLAGVNKALARRGSP